MPSDGSARTGPSLDDGDVVNQNEGPCASSSHTPAEERRAGNRS